MNIHFTLVEGFDLLQLQVKFSQFSGFGDQFLAHIGLFDVGHHLTLFNMFTGAHLEVPYTALAGGDDVQNT